tara:strand:+ start:234 stop:545 length:312 start_codon:yes stop_codon:yes gene_type:complete
MRVLILTGLGLAMLAACSQKSDRETLTEACIADGEAPETCDCITGAMEEKLSPDLFRRTAAAIGREKRDIEDFVESLSMSDQLEFAASLSAMISCELTLQDDE